MPLRNNNNNNTMPFTPIVNSTYCNKDKSRCEIWKCDCGVGVWKSVPHSVVFVSTASVLFVQEGEKTVCFLPSAYTSNRMMGLIYNMGARTTASVYLMCQYIEVYSTIQCHYR